MKALLDKLHSRLGDFWWYSLMLFVALRCGDVINAIVGLWLVPKYVPQEELGAVLPLTQFASLFGLPISILVLVFTKFLAQFQARGETGKIKSLLRWFIGFVLTAAVFSAVTAKWLMPHLFDRIRIQNGSLMILIIAAGITGTVSPVFNNALQGLKKFKAITFINLLSAPIRFCIMLITLPIRALSGYMVGQITPQLFAIGTSCFVLRKNVDRNVNEIPFWRDDRKAILRYLLFCIIWMVPGTIFNSIQAMIIRQRLIDIESAAYYMINTFAALSTYLGMTLAFVMFPLAAEANEKKEDSLPLLIKMNVSTYIFGGIATMGLWLFGETIFQLLPTFKPYSQFVPDMVLLSAILTISTAGSNYTSYETAHGRFDFLWATIISAIKIAFLVCFTGYTFFEGIIPPNIVNWMGSLHIATLRNVLWVLLAGTVACNLLYLVQTLLRKRS